MKTNVGIFLILIISLNIQFAYSQFSRSELNVEPKDKALKAAKNQATKYLDKGWNVYQDFLALDMRLQTTWVVENEVNDQGSLRYDSGEGAGIADNLAEAQKQAIEWAKLRIIRGVYSANKKQIDPISPDVEKNSQFSDYLSKMPLEVVQIFELLKYSDPDYIFKITREQSVSQEVYVKLYFDHKRMIALTLYTNEIKKEMDDSKLFIPKDEFESLKQFQERKSRAVKFEDAMNKKYFQKYSDDIKAKEDTEMNERKQKIKDSYQKISLPIEETGKYNAETQTLTLKINGETKNVKIPPENARNFKNNPEKIKVEADKQIAADGKNIDIFNIQVFDLVSGAIYPFGEQKRPLFIDDATNTDQQKTITAQTGNQTTEQKGTEKEKTAEPNNIIQSQLNKFLPPLLKIDNIKFRDTDNNNRIDAFENTFIDFTLVNQGKGSAQDLILRMSMSGDTAGLTLETGAGGGTLNAGEQRKFTIPVKANMETARGKVTFTFFFFERNGFDSDPVELTVNTLEFLKPAILVVDYRFMNKKSEKLELGLPTTLKVLIQNTGQGNAELVNIHFGIPALNVFIISDQGFTLGQLNSGESKEIVFEFVANKRYQSSSLPIEITLSEKYRMFAQSTTLNSFINQEFKKVERIDVISEKFAERNIEKASLTPDVDQNIPVNAVSKLLTYVLIIGNEDYSSQNPGVGEEINVKFAENDARIFKEYAVKTLGIPERNIELLVNSSAAEINQGIGRMNAFAKVFRERAELIVYYAGNGAIDEKSKEAYLIPIDASTKDFKYALKVNDVYLQLSEYKTRMVSVFFDVSFGGGNRNRFFLTGATGSEKVVFGGNQINGNLVEFASCSGDQPALAFPEKQHGLFTYYLLKKLQESKGNITYRELGNYIHVNVKAMSEKIGDKAQTPKVNVSEDLGESWIGFLIK